MPKDQFAHEEPLVARLLDRLRIKPDAPLTNPNLDGESGADVLAIVCGKRIGIQVTQIDNGYSLPGVTGAPITGRGAEKRLARECHTYAGFAENDSAKVVANIAAAIRPKALHRVTGFDGLWLLVAVGVPEIGSVISTFVLSAHLSPAHLDAATGPDLVQSSYDRVFLLPVLGAERALFQWAKPSGPWHVEVEPEAAPSLSFDELMARAHEAARSGDLDAWTDREVQKVLAEMRAPTIEGT
ncbi:MAG TPA: hypothetical protein VKZ79_23135 [Alphaproteobacteria bacterium]|nr:hypothetical protein [Alphaproteobacteria bacterium]